VTVPAVLPSTARALELAARHVQSGTRQPSLVAGLVRDEDLVWHTAVGEHTGGAAPGPDLAYRIGSLTKTMTAVLVLQARDDGLLSLDDRLGSLLGADAPFGSARLHDLLSHAAGLPAEPAGEWWERRDGGDFGELAASIADQGLVLPPRQRHHYSNLGYGLLGRAVEQVRGGIWADLVRDWVLAPLGMTATTYSPVEPGERSARGYSVHPFTGRLLDEPSTDTGAMAPAGQLWSTLRDLTRWAVFLLNGNDAVLSDASLTQMRTAAHGDTNGLGTVYGLGLSLHARPSGDRYGHGGSMPGFLAALRVDPHQGAAAIALANATRPAVRAGATDAHALASRAGRRGRRRARRRLVLGGRAHRHRSGGRHARRQRRQGRPFQPADPHWRRHLARPGRLLRRRDPDCRARRCRRGALPAASHVRADPPPVRVTDVQSSADERRSHLVVTYCAWLTLLMLKSGTRRGGVAVRGK
jgi:CubicO group peptidase (beta-lactamase class C family)